VLEGVRQLGWINVNGVHHAKRHQGECEIWGKVRAQLGDRSCRGVCTVGRVLSCAYELELHVHGIAATADELSNRVQREPGRLSDDFKWGFIDVYAIHCIQPWASPLFNEGIATP
jgi:hypothetical protein